MSDQDKVIELLTEIRELFADKDKKYDKYLADAKLMHQQQLNSGAKRSAIVLAVFLLAAYLLFVVVSGP